MKTSLYAWIGNELWSGKPGIITTAIKGHPIPLVAYDKLVAEKCQELIDRSLGHTNIKLIRLEEVEVLREIE